MGPANGVTLNDVYIVDNGVEDLWLKNVNIVNMQDKSAITFDSANKNTLHLFGNNSISDDGNIWISRKSAMINAGGGLSLVGNGSMTITNNHVGGGAIIGSAQGESCGDIKIGQGLKLEIYSKTTCVGAAIGSGGIGGSCGNITIGSNSKVKIIKDTSLYPYNPAATTTPMNAGAAIGCGNGGNSPTTCGNITIYSGANVIAYGHGGPGIGCGPEVSKCGNITIYSDAKVTANSKHCAAIGSGDGGWNIPLQGNPHNNNPFKKSECGDITIYSYFNGDV